MAEQKESKAADPIPGLPPEAKPLRVLLYVLTVLSLAAALALEPALAGAVERGAISAMWLFTPLAVYGVFLLVYAVDRWLLVRRRRYPAGKAFFMVAFGVLFALLLLPSTIHDWEAGRPAGMARLLSHPDSEVRQAAVEALGFRGPDGASVQLVLGRLEDREERVRGSAARVLAAWSGRSAQDVEALRAWASSQMTSTSTSTSGGQEGAH